LVQDVFLYIIAPLCLHDGLVHATLGFFSWSIP